MNTSSNRRQTGTVTFLSGLLVGVVCYSLAESFIPRDVRNPGDHDIALATRLGFIYAPVVGVWLAWLQKSFRRAAVAVVIGVLVGFVYMQLCQSRNFLAIMVGFPALLGGLLASLLASNRSRWLSDLLSRLGKGLVAGFALGSVYMVTLNLVLASAFQQDFIHDPTPAYIKAMWRAGPVALGLASGFFFALIRWAVGLTRVKLLVFEETEPQKSI